jgi:hypothetical protein
VGSWLHRGIWREGGTICVEWNTEMVTVEKTDHHDIPFEAREVENGWLRVSRRWQVRVGF